MANESTVDQQQLQSTIDELYRRLSELFPAQRDALRNALNTIQVGENQTLGMLAAADDLATAPVGDRQKLLKNLLVMLYEDSIQTATNSVPLEQRFNLTLQDFGAKPDGSSSADDAVLAFKDAVNYEVQTLPGQEYLVEDDDFLVGGGGRIRKSGGDLMAPTMPLFNPSRGTVLIASRHMPTGILHRSTIAGSDALWYATDLDRVEAYGDNAMMYTRYASRTTMVGSIAGQWLGTDRQTVEQTHNFWISADGKTPGQEGWDYQGYETNNPGIGDRINTFADYAKGPDDVVANVGMGRDAFNGTVRAKYCTGIGYRAMAGAFDVSDCTAVGSDALRTALFGSQSTGVGNAALTASQTTYRDVSIGFNSASKAVRSEKNVVVGAYAAYNPTVMSGSIVIGQGAGNNLSGAEMRNKLLIGTDSGAGGLSAPIVSGDMTKNWVGIGVNDPAQLSAPLHVAVDGVTGAYSTHGLGKGLLVDSQGSAGITVLNRSGSDYSSIMLADRESSNRAGVIYNHSNDRMSLRAAGGDRMVIGDNYIEIASLPTSNPGAGSKRLWVDNGVVKYAA